MTRLKRVLSVAAGGTPAVDDETMWDLDGLPWVSITDMTRSSLVSATERRVSNLGRLSKRLPVGEPGTLLFAMYASVGATAVLDVKASWNQAILGMTPVPGRADLRFLRYWLEHLRRDLPAITRSNTQDNLNAEQVGNFWFPNNGVADQRAIADYLDPEIARIDALIAAKQRMRVLLTERWQLVMQHAVAGRLRCSTSERRPTTVPWLADLPVYWREGHLNLVATLGTGHTPSRSQPQWWVDATIPWITTGEVADMRSDDIEYVYETREKISELGMANSSATLHPTDTVVLCRTASAGYSAIMGSDMATSQDFATWTCGPSLRPRFLLLCLRAMRQDLLGRLAMGSTHKTIYMPDIESIKIPLPDPDEQDQIVAAAYTEHRPIRAATTVLDPSDHAASRTARIPDYRRGHRSG